jgi:hypothetical protein
MVLFRRPWLPAWAAVLRLKLQGHLENSRNVCCHRR